MHVDKMNKINKIDKIDKMNSDFYRINIIYLFNFLY